MLLQTYRHLKPVSAVAWSPDGLLLASASQDFMDEYGNVLLWQLGREEPVYTYQGHGGQLHALAWSPDSRAIASAGQDGTVQVWRVPRDGAVPAHSFSLLVSRPAPTWVDVTWSPDGRYLAACTNRTMYCWQPESGKLRQIYRANRDEAFWWYECQGVINALVWSPDGTRLAGSVGLEGKIQIWEAPHEGQVPTSPHAITFAQGEEVVMRMAWSPDGHYLASVTTDADMQVWDTFHQQLVFTYDAVTGKQFWQVDISAAVAWSPNGTRIASAGSDSLVQAWDAFSGEHVGVYEGHFDAITGISWSPDGRRIASASKDGTVRVWEAVEPEH